ncbi:MAG: amino acid permease [Ignavibacteria bacterium]|nr:amino acid permease [Ignavibacteria bacterium]
MQILTSRPRVLGWIRSAAILDGDWGTSIAYVLGIAFYLSGYQSGWYLMMMMGFTALIAVNYITICRLYPNGGGVYSSVAHRSKTFAAVGAFLLAADYTVTASLSVLDACHYLGLPQPEIFAIVIILGLGLLNWRGPRHAGSFAITISIITFTAIFILVGFSATTGFSQANFEPLHESPLHSWTIFVGIILSISGIEAISNMTGVMKNPAKDSKYAILTVLSKITFATILLALAMLAIPNIERTAHTEDMIRFLGEYYVGNWFGYIIGIALALLLFSAGNTAINALTSLQYMMATDFELPKPLKRLNKYGVPVLPLLISTGIPIVLLIFINDILTLASLYAIGVVGAIFINVASTGTDKSLDVKKFTRVYMLVSAVLLLFVELTIAYQKPKALAFAIVILGIGMIARKLTKKEAREQVIQAVQEFGSQIMPKSELNVESRLMVALDGKNELLLRFVCQEAKLRKAFLFVLNVKRVAVFNMPASQTMEHLQDFSWAEHICDEYNVPCKILIIASNEVGGTIIEQAATLGCDIVYLGASRKKLVDKALSGDVIRITSDIMPEEIQLVFLRA